MFSNRHAQNDFVNTSAKYPFFVDSCRQSVFFVIPFSINKILPAFFYFKVFLKYNKKIYIQNTRKSFRKQASF